MIFWVTSLTAGPLKSHYRVSKWLIGIDEKDVLISEILSLSSLEVHFQNEHQTNYLIWGLLFSSVNDTTLTSSLLCLSCVTAWEIRFMCLKNTQTWPHTYIAVLISLQICIFRLLTFPGVGSSLCHFSREVRLRIAGLPLNTLWRIFCLSAPPPALSTALTTLTQGRNVFSRCGSLRSSWWRQKRSWRQTAGRL